MMYVDLTLTGCLLVLLQAAGLLVAWLARASEETRFRPLCYLLFWGFFGLVGLTTMTMIATSTSGGLFCGSTLALMTLSATCDFGQAPTRPA